MVAALVAGLGGAMAQLLQDMGTEQGHHVAQGRGGHVE